MATKPIVLLLKSPSHVDATEDRYLVELTNASFEPVYVSVLTQSFCHLDGLKQIIAQGPKLNYSGVIITSSRAAEAWELAATSLERIEQTWNETPFYVVGPKTADVLKEGEGDSWAPSSSMVRGAGGGHASALVEFVVEDWNSLPEKLPLLYLTGDKTKETIRTRLKTEDIPFTELKVYDTVQKDTLEADLEAVITEHILSGPAPVWIVFFAPSSASMTLPILSKQLNLPTSHEDYKRSNRPLVRFASIGPTTLAYLSTEHPARFQVDATASSPTAEALVAALTSAERTANP